MASFVSFCCARKASPSFCIHSSWLSINSRTWGKLTRALTLSSHWITSSGYVDAMKICARSGSGYCTMGATICSSSSGLKGRESALRGGCAPVASGANGRLRATTTASQICRMGTSVKDDWRKSSRRFARTVSGSIRVGLLVVVFLLAIGRAGRPVMAAANAESKASAAAPVPVADGETSMSVRVVPLSPSGVFSDTTLVYLAGPIDAGAPDRLAKALDRAAGKIAIWLNSPGGNLFAGMRLGRVIRKHGASTHIIDYGTLLPGECYSACSLAFLGGVFRFNDNGGPLRSSSRVTPGWPDAWRPRSGARPFCRDQGLHS